MKTGKKLKIIEKKFGIDAYNDLANFIFSQEQKIEELKKSRSHWKCKYLELKRRKDE